VIKEQIKNTRYTLYIDRVSY